MHRNFVFFFASPSFFFYSLFLSSSRVVVKPAGLNVCPKRKRSYEPAKIEYAFASNDIFFLFGNVKKFTRRGKKKCLGC